MQDIPKGFVVFDCEVTTWEGALRRRWSGQGEHIEVVQIGAARVLAANISEKETFEIIIQPTVNPRLSDFFVQLTGITQEVVDATGVSFPEALQRFGEWMGSDYLYSWGGTFPGDEGFLQANCELLGITFPFEPSRFHDMREVFRRAGVAPEGYSSSTIQTALGLPKPVVAHSALGDVRTILAALRELQKRSA
ncbi:exonuclease domain-containing protein [Patescibacteria group bacterium]|nr:exonuclease domain-containing protein [Patescibacteria group bacterium]MBU1889979.1 exonuclease domain-containing protein [Patescibacteria group bacterium]